MKLFVVCCSCLGDSMVIHKKEKSLGTMLQVSGGSGVIRPEQSEG